MSLIAAEATASATLAAIRTAGLEVETGRNSATSIAYSANGLTLRQKETVTTTEYRGLTKAAAQQLEDLETAASDTTASVTYYHQIGDTSDYATVSLMTGGKVDYVPRREDEGDAWTCVKTETAYEAVGAGTGSGWTTTRPSGAASTGVQISKDMRKTWIWSNFYAVETTTVTEYRYLTLSEANAKVSDNTSNNVQMHTYTASSGLAWCYAQAGTAKTAAARYVDAENGYTVTVTQTDYSGEGSGWSY